MTRINFHSMQILSMIASTGSMSRAASEMHMTPSAISKRVAELEARIGTSLLLRQSSGVRLTAAGEIVVRYADELMARVSDMSQEIADLLGSQQGEIRVMSNTTAILLGLLEDITHFRIAHPGIRVTVSEGTSHEVPAAVKRKEVDIGVCVKTDHLRGLTVQAYRQTPLAVVMPASHALAGCSRLGLADLAGNHIVWSPPIKLVDQESPHPGGDLELLVRSFDVVLRSVSEQVGIAVIPYAALPGSLPAGLAIARLEVGPTQFEIVLCHDAGAQHGAATHQLIAWLRSRSCLVEEE